MLDPFMNPLPNSAYLRLLKHQQRVRGNTYKPDLPLVLFIFFSRVAAGLTLFSSLSPDPTMGSGISLGCMILATLSSLAHLGAPQRFLTMLRNNQSYLAWEIRLAGALTISLGLQFLSGLGGFHPYQLYFLWINGVLSVLFLVSTGWAYRFETHPAWKTSLLPLYYLASASIVGLAIQSLGYPLPVILFLFGGFLLAKGLLLALYRNHLKIISPTSLERIVADKKRWVFFAFIGSDLLLPCLLTLALFLGAESMLLRGVFATSCLVGVFLERILFFSVERPVFFLSSDDHPEFDANQPADLKAEGIAYTLDRQ
jgi:DMSO reductase anchor subunit